MLLDECQAAAERPAFSCDFHAIPVSLLPSPRPTLPPSPCSMWVSVSHAFLADAGDLVGNNVLSSSDVSPSPSARSSHRRSPRTAKRVGSSPCSAAGHASLALKTARTARATARRSFPWLRRPPKRNSTAPFVGMLFRGPRCWRWRCTRTRVTQA
jgi:hypothetical protein